MKKIFVLLLILVVAFLLYLYFRTNDLYFRANCEDLSESECRKNENCEGNYGPSSCYKDGPVLTICTADLSYKGCITKADDGLLY